MRRAVSLRLAALNTRVSALPALQVTWAMVLLFSIWVLLDVFHFKFTGGLAQSSFDAMVRARVFVAAPDPRIVIIDIEEASLARMGKEFGRWPWSRDTLATVLDHIEAQQPAAVVWDILFSDADQISPGGDAAFNEAVTRSLHSHFPVVRLPKGNDAVSQITQAALPGLWVAQKPVVSASTAVKASTVALIPPALPAVASSRLGFNNGYTDADGLLRRYRHVDRLPDGSALQSLPMSVLRALNPDAYRQAINPGQTLYQPKDELIAWRRNTEAYPHISFADVFAQAEGEKTQSLVPSFAGKVVIIGATAPSLHDIHPTPLSPMQAGVDSLATALDNALNERRLAELPRWLQAALAIGLCVGLALWAQFKDISSLDPALLVLPAVLLGISYLSLNGLPIFLDLHLPAALALLLLAVLRFWNNLRRNYWCSPPCGHQPLAVWPWERRKAWLDGDLDRLIDAVERHAPSCRVVLCDASVAWPATLRWPELARYAAVVGPRDALLAVREPLSSALQGLADRHAEPLLLDSLQDREHLASTVFRGWTSLQTHKPNSEEKKKN